VKGLRVEAVIGDTSLTGFRTAVPSGSAPALTAARRLVEQHLDSDRLDCDPEALALAALVASRMVGECEHEAVYGGPAGRLLLEQLAGPAPGKKESPLLNREACSLVRRLRALAACGRADAEVGFRVLMAAAVRVAELRGMEAASSLAEALRLAWGPPPECPGCEADCLGLGLFQALRAHLLAAVHGGRARSLAAILPWLGEESRLLRASEAQTLARDFSKALGQENISSTLRDAARPLLEAFRARGGASGRAGDRLGMLPKASGRSVTAGKRTFSWRSRLVMEARRRLKRRRIDPPVPLQAPSEWLQTPSKSEGSGKVEGRSNVASNKRIRRHDGDGVTLAKVARNDFPATSVPLVSASPTAFHLRSAGASVAADKVAGAHGMVVNGIPSRIGTAGSETVFRAPVRSTALSGGNASPLASRELATRCVGAIGNASSLAPCGVEEKLRPPPEPLRISSVQRARAAAALARASASAAPFACSGTVTAAAESLPDALAAVAGMVRDESFTGFLSYDSARARPAVALRSTGYRPSTVTPSHPIHSSTVDDVFYAPLAESPKAAPPGTAAVPKAAVSTSEDVSKDVFLAPLEGFGGVAPKAVSSSVSAASSAAVHRKRWRLRD